MPIIFSLSEIILFGHGDVTVYPKKYAQGFCFAVLCCGYTLTDFPISIRLTSLALWQSNDCPSASKATLMNMDKYFMWIHYERLHNHNKAKHNKTVCIFLGIYCIWTNASQPPGTADACKKSISDLFLWGRCFRRNLLSAFYVYVVNLRTGTCAGEKRHLSSHLHTNEIKKSLTWNLKLTSSCTLNISRMSVKKFISLY